METTPNDRVPLNPEKYDSEYANTPGNRAPAPIDPATGQHQTYWVLPEEERAKGFVRPVRRTYRHDRCGTTTTMAPAIAETFARNPGYYSGGFCFTCGTHFPIAEFAWEDGSRVGT